MIKGDKKTIKEFNYICNFLIEEENKELRQRLFYEYKGKLYQLRLLSGDQVEKLDN